MKFLWPEMLWLLLVLPGLVAGYLYLLRRKQQVALRYPSLSMVKAAMGMEQKYRHIPPLLFLLAALVKITSPGPVLAEAATPVRVKIPAPITAPTPSATSEPGPKDRFKAFWLSDSARIRLSGLVWKRSTMQ